MSARDNGAGPARATPGGTVLVTGGAGFIGINLAHRLLNRGWCVRIFDSLARGGVEHNLRWLRDLHPDRLEVVVGDVRDADALGSAVDGACHVFHLAAQVAVTSSLLDPREDFAINAWGTMNLLEAARRQPEPPGVTYTSTNKVYGALDDVVLVIEGERYVPADPQLRRRGIGETRPLEFHSPYGCSKGAAEQYVLDYARVFGMRNTVLRMSCIYGPHQHGNADQGWVAHFVRSALAGDGLTLYGDGRQVRDLLFIDDFTAALQHVLEHAPRLAGQVFNIGGGVRNTVSLREIIDLLERSEGRRLEYCNAPWREADQKYYVSDITRFIAATGWRPRVGVPAGLRALARWQLDGDESAAGTAPALREPAHLGEGATS